MTELEPIEPEYALELYLKEKETDCADSTVYAHKSRLGHFLRWCDEEKINNLNVLTGRKLHEYRLWRREDGDLSKVTMKTQMDTLRVFVRWLESIDAVEQDLSTKVLSPTITPEENSRDVMLGRDAANTIIAYYEQYCYATAKHVVISLLWHTMFRRSAVRALDLDDYNSDEQYLDVNYRPETDTPIKNGKDGERLVALSDTMCDLLDDYISERRHDVTDDHGREPLLTSREGRLHKTTIQQYCYQITRPCEYGQECPHDRDPDECEAVNRDSASKCPSSVSPHAVRRGSITDRLRQDVPDKVVSDRANVSPKVIEQHYDRRTEREKMEQRRHYLID